MPLIFALLFVFFAAPALAQTPCGSEGPACETPLGTYRIALPDSKAPEAGYPALVFFHGAGGSGARTLTNQNMVDTFRARGWAVLAPDGLARPNSRFGPGWSFNPVREKLRDEAAFLREIVADAAQRHTVDAERILMSGFSVGGSLVWYLACEDATLAKAYAPVAGAFWRPHPKVGSCSAPLNLLHTHGWRDRVVPLEGRPLSGESMQGDVYYGLMLLRDLNGCSEMRADTFNTDGPFWRRVWNACTPGTRLEFALHTGGHAVPEAWPEMALDWFAALEAEGL